MTIQLKTKRVYQISHSNYNDKVYASYYSKQYIIDPTDAANIKSFINKILSTNDTVNSSDIIYTSQASEIPRFKLKEFIKEKGIKRTSRMEQGNCFILSKKLIQDLLGMNDLFGKPTDMYFTTDKLTDEVLNFLSKENKNNNYYELPKKVDGDDELFFLNKDGFKSISVSAKWSKYSSYLELRKYNFLYHRNAKSIDLINMLLYIQNNPNIKIVFDENLITDLNKEGLQLDTDIENTLKDMIYSKDKSNIKLGLEMIANLELNDYTLYKMSLILNNFVNIGSERQARTNRGVINQLAMNNRNLKTLLNTFKSKDISWNGDWKEFAGGLIKNFAGTEQESLIKEYLIDRLNNEFKSLSGGVKIEDLKFAK